MEGFMQSFWMYAYFAAAFATVFSIKWLSHPSTARRGVIIGEIGFTLAILGTLLRLEAVPNQYIAILIAIAIGAMIGAPMAKLMPMTSVPRSTSMEYVRLCAGPVSRVTR